MRKLAYLLTSLLVCGCFFDNKTEVEPNKKVQKTEVLGGEIYLKDIHGVDRGAEAEAYVGLYKVENEKKEIVSRFYRGMTREVTANTSPCTIERKQKKAQRSVKLMEILSVGKFGFTTLSSEELVDIPETENHTYHKTLKEGMPSGAYKFVAEGNGRVPKFGVLLSMPEDLTKVIINGSDFSTDPVNIKKSENLKASWNSTVYENEKDTILLKVLTENNDEYIDLICGVKERTLKKENGMTTWEIDKAEFQDLALTTDLEKLALIGLFRYHHIIANDREPLFDLVGMRMYNTRGGVGE